jgi:hypothetical protein
VKCYKASNIEAVETNRSAQYLRWPIQLFLTLNAFNLLAVLSYLFNVYHFLPFNGGARSAASHVLFIGATMGHNTVPAKVADLLLFAERMAHDLEAHGPPFGATDVSTGGFRHIIDQARQAETAWLAARSARESAQARMAVADEALSSWLAKARLVVMLARGSKWSERWIEAGFAHRATNVPRRMELRINLASRLVVFLALHPDFAVPFAEVTAASGRPIYERMIQMRAALELAIADCSESKRRRDAAVGALRCTLRQLRTPDHNRAAVHVRSAEPIGIAAPMQSNCPQPVAA